MVHVDRSPAWAINVALYQRSTIGSYLSVYHSDDAFFKKKKNILKLFFKWMFYLH